MLGTPVQLWMYDLSKGMAKHVSKLFSRREIDGIWWVQSGFMGQFD